MRTRTGKKKKKQRKKNNKADNGVRFPGKKKKNEMKRKEKKRILRNQRKEMQTQLKAYAKRDA